MVILSAAVLAGCGDDAAETAGTTGVATPSATPPGAPPSTTPTPEGTPESTPTATVPGTPQPTPAATEKDGGDEDGNRTELRFEVLARGIQPARIEVPAFLGLRIRVRNQSGDPRPLILGGKPLGLLTPGQSDVFEAEGLRPGEHALEAGPSGRATIVAVRAGG